MSHKDFSAASLVLCALFVAASVHAGQPKTGDAKKGNGKDMKESKDKDSKLETVVIPVTGMMCNNCVTNVQMAFKKSTGVTEAKADGVSSATVTFDPSKITLEKILAEFKVNKAPRFDAYKPGETPAYTYSGKDETLGGRLSVKPADAAGDVVCRIFAKRNGEKNERFFNLLATGDMAKTIDTVRKEGREVRVTGIASDAGIKVSKID